MKSAHKLGKESFANIQLCYTNKTELKGAMANVQVQKMCSSRKYPGGRGLVRPNNLRNT